MGVIWGHVTKRSVDALRSNASEFTAWDDTVSCFGVRVRPAGAKSYLVVYRAGAGRGASAATPSRQSGKSRQSALGRVPRSSLERWRMGTIQQTRRLPSAARLTVTELASVRPGRRTTTGTF